tara:strand:- start:1265 stop:1780 length:516 start_codon:yes stop_codon:yes gene_type:complete
MKKIWIGFSSLFVVIGIVVLILGLRSIFRANESNSWPNAEGVVVSAEMERYTSSDSGTTYGAEIEYEFQFEDQLISGSRVKFGEIKTSDPGDARKYLNKYKVGNKINVYYDPNDLYESVLEPGIHTSTLFVPCIGFVFTLVGSIFLAIGIFSDSRKLGASRRRFGYTQRSS